MLRRVDGGGLHRDPPPGRRVPPVRADPGQLEQVLLNLTLNARDAMPRGGTLTVETFVTELSEDYARARPGVTVRPGAYAVLAVSDTGHGMDRRDAQPRLRALLHHQGRGARDRARTLHRLRHRQAVRRLRLGLQRAGAGQHVQGLSPGRAGRRRRSPARRRRLRSGPARGEWVLLVEDDEGVRRGDAARVLEEAGYRVLEAANGADALDAADAGADRQDRPGAHRRRDARHERPRAGRPHRASCCRERRSSSPRATPTARSSAAGCSSPVRRSCRSRSGPRRSCGSCASGWSRLACHRCTAGLPPAALDHRNPHDQRFSPAARALAHHPGRAGSGRSPS